MCTIYSVYKILKEKVIIMSKQIIYDSDAKEKILAGVNKLEKSVTCTLGPLGKNVIIDDYGTVKSTKDGVSIAKVISLKDPFENLGASAIKEVAEKSNEKVGDGTTTSTLLAATIYRNGLKYVNVGANATQIKNGIKIAADYVVDELKRTSVKISNTEDVKHVATVSANGDKKIGSIIADVMEKIGNDGTIKIEDGNTSDLTSKIVKGMVIDQSYVSPYMVTNSETMEAELDNPWIMLVNKKVSNIQEIVNSLNSIAQTGRPLLIIADDFAEDILGTLVFNKMKTGFTAVTVKSPSYGDNRKLILDDIAILCGGKVISDDVGIKLEDATVESGILGQAKRVIVNKENTIIIDGLGDKAELEKRVEGLRKQIEACNETYDKEKLQERLAKLTSGIGIISVGAVTKTEQKELKDRVDDAFSAAKAALREGIVIGGGCALLKIMQKLKNWKNDNLFADVVGDEEIGIDILVNSLEAPVRKILTNANIDASYVISTLLSMTDEHIGYNVLKKDYVDMFADEIVDPTEVVINEVQNSASIAGLLLTTECLICEAPVETNNQSGGYSSSGCSGCGSHAPIM